MDNNRFFNQTFAQPNTQASGQPSVSNYRGNNFNPNFRASEPRNQPHTVPAVEFNKLQKEVSALKTLVGYLLENTPFERSQLDVKGATGVYEQFKRFHLSKRNTNHRAQSELEVKLNAKDRELEDLKRQLELKQSSEPKNKKAKSGNWEVFDDDTGLGLQLDLGPKEQPIVDEPIIQPTKVDEATQPGNVVLFNAISKQLETSPVVQIDDKIKEPEVQAPIESELQERVKKLMAQLKEKETLVNTLQEEKSRDEEKKRATNEKRSRTQKENAKRKLKENADSVDISGSELSEFSTPDGDVEPGATSTPKPKKNKADKSKFKK